MRKFNIKFVLAKNTKLPGYEAILETMREEVKDLEGSLDTRCLLGESWEFSTGYDPEYVLGVLFKVFNKTNLFPARRKPPVIGKDYVDFTLYLAENDFVETDGVMYLEDNGWKTYTINFPFSITRNLVSRYIDSISNTHCLVGTWFVYPTTDQLKFIAPSYITDKEINDFLIEVITTSGYTPTNILFSRDNNPSVYITVKHAEFSKDHPNVTKIPTLDNPDYEVIMSNVLELERFNKEKNVYQAVPQYFIDTYGERE